MATAVGTKAILDKVLTRWCNVHLPQDCQLKDLSCLKDVSKAVILLEELSGNKWDRRTSAAAGTRRLLSKIFLKKNEWDGLLEFIEKDERVELEQPVDSKDVAKGDLESIRILVWSLVLHYLIKPTISSFPPSCPALQEPSISKKLFSFVSEKLSSNLKNLTSSWSDGTLLMGLIESLSPEKKECEALFQHEEKQGGEIDVAVVLEHAQTVFGVPKLLVPTEFSSGSIDERSMSIYLFFLLSKADLSSDKETWENLKGRTFIVTIYDNDASVKPKDVFDHENLKEKLKDDNVIVTVVRCEDTAISKTNSEVAENAVRINILFTEEDPYESIPKALKDLYKDCNKAVVINTTKLSTKEPLYHPPT